MHSRSALSRSALSRNTHARDFFSVAVQVACLSGFVDWQATLNELWCLGGGPQLSITHVAQGSQNSSLGVRST